MCPATLCVPHIDELVGLLQRWRMFDAVSQLPKKKKNNGENYIYSISQLPTHISSYQF